jgi:hypothetical protein
MYSQQKLVEIEVQSVEAVEASAAILQKQATAAEYQVTLLDAVKQLNQKIHQLLAPLAIIRQRRGKEYDLRPLEQDMQYPS